MMLFFACLSMIFFIIATIMTAIKNSRKERHRQEAIIRDLLETVEDLRPQPDESRPPPPPQLEGIRYRHPERQEIADPQEGSHSATEERECVICKQNKKDVLFLPCRHLCTCRSCADKIDDCPLCRTEIAADVDVYQ